jgi:hypothetical protein
LVPGEELEEEAEEAAAFISTIAAAVWPLGVERVQTAPRALCLPTTVVVKV